MEHELEEKLAMKDEAIRRAILDSMAVVGSAAKAVPVHESQHRGHRITQHESQDIEDGKSHEEHHDHVTPRDRNDPASGLASPNPTANLSGLVLGCIEVNFFN